MDPLALSSLKKSLSLLSHFDLKALIPSLNNPQSLNVGVWAADRKVGIKFTPKKEDRELLEISDLIAEHKGSNNSLAQQGPYPKAEVLPLISDILLEKEKNPSDRDIALSLLEISNYHTEYAEHLDRNSKSAASKSLNDEPDISQHESWAQAAKAAAMSILEPTPKKEVAGPVMG
jgi:hypothetical protein